MSRTTSLPVLLLIGLAQGVQPLIAYNYAAGNRKRLTGTMKLTALSGTALALLLAVLLYALAGPVVSAFLDKAEVVRLGRALPAGQRVLRSVPREPVSADERLSGDGKSAALP